MFLHIGDYVMSEKEKASDVMKDWCIMQNLQPISSTGTFDDDFNTRGCDVGLCPKSKL